MIQLPDFYKTREREIFAERVSFESVISQDPPEVGVIGEEDTEHVPQLSLVPVSRL